MRFVPLISAAAVSAALYVLVFERERLIAFASGDTPVVSAPAAPSPAAPSPAAPSPGDTAAEASAGAGAAADPAVRQAVSVLVQRSVVQAIDNAILARGRTEAARQVEVKSETTGLVISDPLRRGAYVTTGQALCSLDPGSRPVLLLEAEGRLAEARAKLAEAEINDRAASRLSAGGFASDIRVATTNAGVQSARAGVAAAESSVAQVARDIARLTIAAPFDGLLETDTAELGALLQPGTACATVIQLDPVKLVGFLAETDVDKVQVGAIAGARLASGHEAVGRVTFLSRSADPATRTFRVEVTVANAGLAIRDGQTAELQIATEGQRAHLLPGSALTLDDDGRLGVRVVDADSRALFVPVTLLRDTRQGVWLTGLPDSADVIVVGQEFVIDGVPVVVTLKPTDPASGPAPAPAALP